MSAGVQAWSASEDSDDQRGPALAAVLHSLDRDLAAWIGGTQSPPLDKHASQVARLARQLTTAVGDLSPLVEDPARRSEVEHAVLDLHSIWDFYRSKLALRLVPWYQPLLGAADDLAWAGYRPARDAASTAGLPTERLKEPPLIFLSRTAVPFAVPRGVDYAQLLPQRGLWTDLGEQVVSSLPVPVVSLPWHRTTWLPVLLSVAHETGHVIVADLGLDGELRTRIQAASLPEQRRQAWSQWREEVFADLFAALLCGGATSLSMASLLNDDTSGGPTPGDWGRYPPVSVRLRLMSAAACRRNREAPVASVTGHVAGFDEDVPEVVKAMLDEPLPQLGGRVLADLYPPVDGDQLYDDVERLTRGRSPSSPDVQSALAAATVVADSAPRQYAQYDVEEWALRQIANLREVGRRGQDVSAPASGVDTVLGHQLGARLLTPLRV